MCNEFCWRRAEFRISTRGCGGRDPVTDAQLRHAVAHGGHRSGDFSAQHERQLAWVGAGAEIGVDEVDADCLGFDQYLTRPGRRLWLLDVAQDFRTADFGDFDCMHSDYHPQSWSPHEVGPPRHSPSPDCVGRFGGRRRRGPRGRIAQARPARALVGLGRPAHARRRSGDPEGRQRSGRNFLAWTTRVPNLLNAPEVVAWNTGRRHLRDLGRAGVPVLRGRRPSASAVRTALVFLGGVQAHAFVENAPVEADFELWEVGQAALQAAADHNGIGVDELLYARADVIEETGDAELVELNLVAPGAGLAATRGRCSRRRATSVRAVRRVSARPAGAGSALASTPITPRLLPCISPPPRRAPRPVPREPR